MENLLETALKSQSILGGIHFLIFVFSWPFVIGYLRNYHDQFRFAFNCLPKPSDYTRLHCYDRYVSSLSPLLTPLDISGITFGVLGFLWVCFIIMGGWLKRRIEKEQDVRRKKRQKKTFLLTFTCHVCFQFVVLLVMMVLFCGFQTLEFPASYWCTQGNITLSPTKQVFASNMTCKDAWYKEKSKLNTLIITIMSLSIFLCLLTMLHLLVTRRAFLEHLLGNITSPDEEQSIGLVAGCTEDSSAKHANSIEKGEQSLENKNSTLLHSAAQSGNVDIIRTTLSLGLDIDSRNTKGYTPLMIAAFNGQPDAFHFLLERGSDPTLKSNDRRSLLHHAARGGRKVIIEKLLSLELDIDSKDNDGSTPLMVAASYGQPDAFYVLLERGSDAT